MEIINMVGGGVLVLDDGGNRLFESFTAKSFSGDAKTARADATGRFAHMAGEGWHTTTADDEIHGVAMTHKMAKAQAALLPDRGFPVFANRTYGEGVYFTNETELPDGDLSDMVLVGATLDEHRQLVVGSAEGIAKASREICGKDPSMYSSWTKAMLEKAIGSVRFPLGDKHYTVVLDANLINIKSVDHAPYKSAKYSEDEPRDDHGRWTTSGNAFITRDKDGVWSGSDGKPLPQADQERLAKLKLPPAWKDVRLNPDPKGDLQALGKDSKGRTQYAYSSEHSERQAAEKFKRLASFNKELPAIRQRIANDLHNPKLSPAEREAALVTHLIDKTGFRIGSNSETQAKTQAYGASTLLAKHVKVEGDTIKFDFIGKKGVRITKTLEDPLLAKELGARKESMGWSKPLFDTTDGKVRGYLHSRDGDFKVKDFRTWHGTTKALHEIEKQPPPRDEKSFIKRQKIVCQKVADHLGNTAAVAKASYIDPAVWSKWKGGIMKASKMAVRDEDALLEEMLETVRYMTADGEDAGSAWESMPELATSEDEPTYADYREATDKPTREGYPSN